MDDIRLIDALFTVLLLALGGLFTLMRETIKEAQTNHKTLETKVDERDAAITEKIANLRDTVSRDYMPRTEVNALMHEIRTGFQRIEDKLDGKVDKP
jgi:septation ring formation regulator EzrA